MTNLFTKLARAYSALFLLTICALLISANTSFAQVSVTATAGTTGPTAYTTVNSAFAAINAGTHQGAINIAISANTTEPAAPTVLEASGVGTSNYTSIAIYPTASNVVIIGNTNASTGVLVFNGADNITINGNLNNGTGTIRNLEIQNNQGGISPGSHAVLWFRATTTGVQLGSTNIVIKNTLIRANGNPAATSATSPYAVGLLFAGTTTTFPSSATLGANHSNITLDNNLFQKAGTAIHMGNATTAPITGLTIINNDIGSNDAADYVYHRGMWLSNTSAALIKQNHIFNLIVGTVQTATRIGIEITGTGSSSAILERNHIHGLANFNTGGYAGYGIVLSGGSNHTVVNNLIYDISGTSWNTQTDAATGIRMTSGTGHKLYYNSINLYGTLTGTTTANTIASSPIVISSTAVIGIDIRNNILNNKSTSPNVPNGEHLAIWFPASYNFGAAGNVFNNNGYHVTGGSTNHYVAKVGITSGSGLYADLSALQAITGQDAQSVPLVNTNAPFTADNILTIPSGTITPLESGGVVISSLPIPNTDYNNFARPAGTGTAPDIGAFEFEGAVPSGCSTTPTAGSATISQTSVCIGQGVDLTLTGQTVDIGIEINWQQSSTGAVGSFTDIPGAIDPVYSTGPLTATTYFRARVTCSGAAQPNAFSNEVSVIVNNPQILSTSTNQRCGPGTVTLGATADPQYNINWYENAVGGTPLSSGSSFTTPVLNNSTTYYVAANQGGITTDVGRPAPVSPSNLLASPRGLIFNANQNVNINSVTVFSTAASAGSGTIEVRNNSNVTIAGPVSVSWAGGGSTASPIAYVLPLNLSVPAGTNYRLFMTTMTGGGISYEFSGIDASTWAAYATPGNEVQILASITSFTGSPLYTSYYYFYNWNVSTGCEGTRVPVTATINAAPALTLTSDETVCNEEIITLNVTSNVNDFDSYFWSPIDNLYLDASATNPYLGGSATTLYFKSSNPGPVTYTVNAYNNATTCSGIATTEIFVQPSAVPVASSNVGEVCISGTVNFFINPSSGYAPGSIYWQVSNDNVTYTDIPGANSATYSATVSSSSYYRVEVRNSTVCSQSNSVFILRNNPEVLSTTPGSRCGIGTVDLGATGSAGVTLNWYENPTGGTPIGTGNSFTTPTISSTTDYFVAASSGGGGVASAGLLNAISTTGYTLEAGLFFDAVTDFTIDGVYVYPIGTGAGTATIALQNSSGTTLQSVVANLTGTGAPYVKTYVPLNFIVTPGNDYRLVMLSRAGSVSGLIRESGTSWGSYPLTLPGTLSITAGKCCPDGISTSYYYFYDWQVSTGCESARVPVTATVNTPPALEVTGDFEICDGTSTTLTVTTGASDYTNFVWSPSTGLSSTTGTSVVANPTENTEYTVIASGNINGCQNEDVFTVEVIHVDVEITSDISPVCGSTPANLTSSVFSEAATEIFANNTSMVIPATGTGASTGAPASVYPSTVTVSGVSASSVLRSVTLKNISHEFPDDIDIVLVSPTNQYVILMSDAGGSNDFINTELIFSDNASSFMSDAGANPSGTYKPSNFLTTADAFPAPGPGSITQLNPSLSLFTGDPNGTWSLYVVDDASGQAGTLEGWGLEFIDYTSFAFNWSPSTGLSSTSISNPTALPPLGSTTYTLTVTESNSGCVGSSDITLHRADPQVVSFTDDTRCGLGEVNLSATGQTGEMIAWWDSPSSVEPIHLGNNFDPFIINTTTYYASSIGAVVSGSLTSTFANGLIYASGVSAGNMFDITAMNNIIVTGFDIHLNHSAGTLADIEVYYKTGTFTGFQTNPAAWTLLTSLNGVSSAGFGNPTPLNFGFNIPVLAGETVAFYITTTNGTEIAYTTGNLSEADNNIALNFGAALVYPFGNSQTVFNPRTWNGTVQYSLFCESPRVPVTANVTAAPIVEVSGGPFMCEDEPITLTVSTGASDYTSFEWSPATGLNTTTGTSVVASPIQNTTYIVFASGNLNGCQTTDTIDIQVASAPPLTLTASGTFFCDVANATLSTGGGGSPTVTLGTGTSNSSTTSGPMYISSATSNFLYSKHIAIYTAAEILGAGGTAGLINQISWYKTNTNGYINGDAFMEIYVKPVTFNQHASTPINWANEIVGATLVYSSNSQNLNTSIGWQDFLFATPFNWNGTDNLEVFVDFYRPGNATGAVNWQYTATTNANAITGNSSPVTTASRNSNRPNVMFGFQQSLSYAWSPSTGLSSIVGPTVTATPTTTSTYSVVVTDNLTGCTSTDSITIIVDPTPTPVITSTIPNPVCQGQLSVLSSQYTSGNGYQFNWNSGLVSTETIDASIPGDYTLIVTSPNGCTSNLITYTVEFATIFADIGGTTEVLCNGDSTGTVTINALGTLYDPSGNVTFGPFAYSANGDPFQSSSTLTGLWAGNHNITVYDSASGCSVNIVALVTEPPVLVAGPVVINQNVSCNGLSDGSATVSASGGVGPYIFNWNTPIPKQGEIHNEIPAGTWTITVTDANGCTATTTVTITQPPVLNVTIASTNSTYWSANNGTATATATGGTPLYSYLWSTSQTTAGISGLAPGSYTVTVTDANGCVTSATVLITEPAFQCSGSGTHTKWGPGGWGGTPNGANPATYMYANFAAAFPNGLTIGHPLNTGCNRSMKWTTPQAITAFLPSTGTPRRLDAGHKLNFTSVQYGNTLAAQVVALTINVVFDAYDPNLSPNSTVTFGSMIICISGSNNQFNGWTVNQLLTEANNVLACGGTKNYISAITDAIDKVNNQNNATCCPSSPVVKVVATAPVVDNDEFQLNVYPNPTRGNITVSFEAEEKTPTEMFIMDMQGRIVMNIALDGSGNFSKEIDLGLLENGIYILNLIDREGIISTSRVVKTQ